MNNDQYEKTWIYCKHTVINISRYNILFVLTIYEIDENV